MSAIFPSGPWELLKMSAHNVSCDPPGDVEPDQLHDAQRARVDVQHAARTRGARICVQHDRAHYGRFEDDPPGDVELGVEYVRAGGKDDAADACVGECTEQAHAGAHRGLQLTAVAGHKLHGVQPRNVAGLGAGQHGAQKRQRRQ